MLEKLWGRKIYSVMGSSTIWSDCPIGAEMMPLHRFLTHLSGFSILYMVSGGIEKVRRKPASSTEIIPFSTSASFCESDAGLNFPSCLARESSAKNNEKQVMIIRLILSNSSTPFHNLRATVCAISGCFCYRSLLGSPRTYGYCFQYPLYG